MGSCQTLAIVAMAVAVLAEVVVDLQEAVTPDACAGDGGGARELMGPPVAPLRPLIAALMAGLDLPVAR